MRLTSVLAQLTLWASSVHAFHPFVPEGQLKARADLETRTSSKVRDAKTISYGIKQRAQPSRQAKPEVLAREAARLSRKYATRTPPNPGHDDMKRRSYDYKIDKAEQPSTPNSEGVDQDGTDYSYFIPVGFGAGDTQLYMLIDTGAGSTWVMGSNCTEQACNMHDTLASSTTQSGDTSFSVSYGSGQVSGNLVTDEIKVADMSFSYQFGMASNVSDDFVHFAFDGILGLSMEIGANANFLQAVQDNKALDRNIFAVALDRAADGPNTGVISFGTLDNSQFTGNIKYLSLGNGAGQEWAVVIDEMSYDGNPAGVGGILSYIDTGTSYIFGPQDLVKKLHSVIPNSDTSDGVTWQVPCNSEKALTFTFDGVDFEVSPKDWVGAQDGNGMCTSNIYGQEVVAGSWLLGDTFLKNVYAVFDVDTKSIGFANRTDSSNGSSSSASATPTASPSHSSNSMSFSTMTITSDHVNYTTTVSIRPSGHEPHAATDTAAAPSSTASGHSKDSSASRELIPRVVYGSVAFICAVIMLL